MKNNTTDEQTSLLGYSSAAFCERVEMVMHHAKLDYDALADKFCEAGYTITPSNLKQYIKQRNPSLKLLKHLSDALNVSIDYLMNNKVRNTITLHEGFDYAFDSPRYAQYKGKYYVYFYPTRTNEPEELIEATLMIDKEQGFYATLKIPVPDGEEKVFNGHLLLSARTYTAFISMYGNNGEMIQFTLNDLNSNQNKLRFSVAALVSVSSGDAKRMPTLSRAIISEQRLLEAGHLLEANLRLNSKYINIHEDALMDILTGFLEKEGIGNADEICKRITFAFKKKTYYSIEEQYFLNTFKGENHLSNKQIETLIAELRNNSMSDINCKIPKSIDARLYLLMKDEGMFDTTNE